MDTKAFTVGNNIAFNSGEYDPSSPEGQHVIANELAHVRQQTGGAVSMLPQDDVELEKEAEETAQRVMQGGDLGIQRMEDTAVHVQRMSGVDRGDTFSPGSSPSGAQSSPQEEESGLAFKDVTDKGDLGQQVAALAENQQKLRTQVEGMMQSTAEKVGVETGKGILTATGGMVGTTLLGPGVGTVAGGVAGGAMYERNFDAGTQAMANGAGKVAEMGGDLMSAIDSRVKSAVDRFLGSWTGSGNDPLEGEK